MMDLTDHKSWSISEHSSSKLSFVLSSLLITMYNTANLPNASYKILAGCCGLQKPSLALLTTHHQYRELSLQVCIHSWDLFQNCTDSIEEAD